MRIYTSIQRMNWYVVAIVFQINFYIEMYMNDIFLFFKNYF
jgi:hypothetical protein